MREATGKARFRRLLLGSREKTSFPATPPSNIPCTRSPSEVAPHLNSQKSVQYTATAVSSRWLQYHLRGPSTIPSPRSVSISGAFRRDSRRCIDPATSRPPSARDGSNSLPTRHFSSLSLTVHYSQPRSSMILEIPGAFHSEPSILLAIDRTAATSYVIISGSRGTIARRFASCV